MKSPEPWVSLEAIASHLDVSPDTVYRWIEKKDMPCTKIGSRWKFKVSKVDAWVESGKASDDHPEPSGSQP